jgi:predicted GTPase
VTKPSKAAEKTKGYSRVALLVVALLLPAASLIPLGSLWLWEHGYIIYWAIGTCLAVSGTYYLQSRLIVPLPPEAVLDLAATDPGDANWAPRQASAWADVMTLASSVKADRMTSRDAVLNLGLETIEVVARRLHPEDKDPLLQFTVPEALAVIERASGNLRDFLVGSFPLGDKITVAQLMWLYRWRGALRLAEKGYDLWRIVRMLNPVAAATQELRERFTRQIYDMGREHLARRLARAYVKEIGRAAIDLYGGNLRVSRQQLRAHVTSASRQDLAAVEAQGAEPVRILVAGQTGAGKSSLVNALANAVEAVVDAVPATSRTTAYRLTHEGLSAALIIDSPGLSGPGLSATDKFDDLIEAADNCDMVLWVCAAARAARDIDSRALAAIREHFAAQPNRRRPPLLLVLTHIDSLRPFNEWDPPYDLATATRAKSVSIRGAMEAAGGELGFAAEETVPVRVDIAVAPYNVDAVWAKIIELMPEAQRARLLRTLSDINSASSWSAIWSQAANAGRVIKGTFLSRNPSTAP